MGREKEGYRDMLELITGIFPGRTCLHVEEAAKAVGVNRKTITEAINKIREPLPARTVGRGKKNRTYIIPITGLARWAVSR